MSGQPPTAQPLPPQGDPYGSPMGHSPHRPSGDSNGLVLGLGITGLVIGIMALMLSFVTCFGALAIWPGAIAVVFSGVATFVGFSSNASSKGLAVAALIVSLLAVAGGVYQRMQLENFIDKGGKQLKKGVDKFSQEMNKAVKEAQKKDKK